MRQLRAVQAMGACKAPISSLLSSPNPNIKTLKTPLLNPETTSRRFLLFSLPLSTLILPSSYALGSGKLLHPSFMAALAASFDPVSQAEKDASTLISRRVSEAVELLERGKELQAQGDFPKALHFFTLVVENYKDFAFSDYARVGRALALYEVGDREEAIAEMEDVSLSLKGYPEVHAALAAALYVDKHAPLLAENQFAIATLLDPHFTDLSYVIETKHWPPSLKMYFQAIKNTQMNQSAMRAYLFLRKLRDKEHTKNLNVPSTCIRRWSSCRIASVDLFNKHDGHDINASGNFLLARFLVGQGSLYLVLLQQFARYNRK